MDKSAKEMFEDLGYECNDYSDKPKEDDLYAVYVYELNKRLKDSSMAIYKEIAFFPNINKVEMDINDDFYQIEDCLWDIEEIKAVNKQIEELRMNKKRTYPLYKEVTLSKELLDKIFPVGCIYNILYDLWGDEEEQIKNGLEKLNNMIGEWEYFGILYAGLAICFKRKK